MVAKPVLVPGPDHPISIETADGRVVVKAAGRGQPTRPPR